MQQTAKGDQSAFRTLARTMGGRMFGLAYRLMNGDASSAEDAVQDTLIKIWTSAPNWKPVGRAESYIMTILHHTCMDAHRKRHPTDLLNDDVPDTGTGALNELIETERHSRLMQGISALPERQRTAVLLSYFGDESNRRIADVLNVTEGAVESLLVRARRTLARDLPDDLRPARAAQKGEAR